MRFWRPMSQKMWMPSHMNQAVNPLKRTMRKSATARSRPMVASSPRVLELEVGNGHTVAPGDDRAGRVLAFLDAALGHTRHVLAR